MMERRKLFQLMAGTAAVALMPGLTGCVVERNVYQPVPAPRPAYRPPEYYNYYYYPAIAVYFQIQTGYYWYYSHGAWRRSRRLPSHIHLRGPRRIIVIRDENPYAHYRDHSRRYGHPDRGYGPDDRWEYDRNGRGRGGNEDGRGNGQDRGRNDNDWNNGRDGRQGGPANDNPVNRPNRNQNNGRPWGGDDHDNSSNRDRNADQGGGRPWGGDEHNNSPSRDRSQGTDGRGNRPWGGDEHDNGPALNGHTNRNGGNQTPLRDRYQRPSLQQPRSAQPSQAPQQPGSQHPDGNSSGNKPKPGSAQNNGSGNGNGKGKQKGAEDQWPWLRKGNPDN